MYGRLASYYRLCGTAIFTHICVSHESNSVIYTDKIIILPLPDLSVSGPPEKR